MEMMEYFKEQAPTRQEALERIRFKYGDRAKPVTCNPVRTGGFLGFFTRKEVEVVGYLATGETRQLTLLDPKKEKEKILEMAAPPKQADTLEQVLKAVESLREKLNVPASASAGVQHSSIEKIRDVLMQNDFSFSYTEKICDRLKKEFSLNELENFDAVQNAVADWIGESIPLYRQEKELKPHVYILVGPTGVGKTTTIAKLAAMYGITASQPLDVRILTIDDFRIAAREQIEKYGEIMKIPVAYVGSPQDFKKRLALNRDADLILVDTIGNSPNDSLKLAKMRELLKTAAGNSSVHLAVSATTKTQDILDIMRQFEPFGYESLVVTKLDETSRVGGIISAAAENRKPLSFITDGQDVANTIKTAAASLLLGRLQGIRFRRVLIEGKFGNLEE
jgi:flagellar biosynthesis protein FlhF